MSIYRYILFIALLVVPAPLSAADVLQQDMVVHLSPDESRLQAEVRITRSSVDMDWPDLYQLAPQTKITALYLDGMPASYDFSGGQLSLSIAHDTKVLTLNYSAVFNDPVPQDIVGIEDPSYGVNGTITTDGAYLSANSGWHPVANSQQSRYRVTVLGDGLLTGVTNGRMTDYTSSGDTTRITWETAQPQRAMSLAAGHYQVEQRSLGKVQAMVFLTGRNSALASGYLDAVTEYLSLYQELFGPYPYEKFAVVENFFPTGYGLAGWTLLGSRVVRLPFIKTTSLPHEIAHAWWGNSVGIDYGAGNWGEGLATYVADYYLKELKEQNEATEYRRKLVRDYAALVTSETDAPLVDFRSRKSKRDQAIGYGKAAMVFHMLRTKIGDEAFWQGLKNVASEGRGQRYGWTDLKRHFAQVAGVSLDQFFSQWVERKGAPSLRLSGVEVLKVGSTWQVSGTIHQDGPVYELAVPLLLDTGKRQYQQVIGLSHESDCFVFTVAERPVRLSLDHDNQLFRQLYGEELPATINHLRASDAQLVVVAEGRDELLAASRDLLRGLHWHSAPIVTEQEFPGMQSVRRDVLFLGRPGKLSLRPSKYRPAGQEFGNPDRMVATNEALFMVDKRSSGERAVAYFLPGSVDAALDTARRISHYGRYSYLVFNNGVNMTKGTWEPKESPLVIDLDKGYEQ